MTVEFKTFLPDGWTAPPDTPLDALRAARDLLRDEHKWTKGDWFQNEHPEVDPEDPFCNSWKVCAEGAVAMVTIGACRWDEQPVWTFRTENVPDGTSRLYTDAVNLLAEWLAEKDDRGFDAVPEFNDADSTTYDDVMAAFEAAIEEQESDNQ